MTQSALAEEAIRDSLTFPVDCELGTTCVIQNYVDRDPGPGVADFTCGPLSYNGHRGTDIRLPDDAAMQAGVDVLSATDGIVLGTRDGMRDRRLNAGNAADIAGKECGNGVLVERDDGVRVQYCHLRKDSIAVRKGDVVHEGQPLGQIGLSGKTQFPHLHFTVRNPSGSILDPFDTRLQDATCKFRDRYDLWRTLNAQDYQPGGLLKSGFSDVVPKYASIQKGTAGLKTLKSDAPAIVFWAHFFGLRSGDVIGLLLTSPTGEVLSQSEHKLTRNRAREFRATGLKARKPWSSGTYRGIATLIRDNAVISTTERSLILP